ncbi:hypothetical protein AAVH_08558 [Aphelenchoides avenae]|nr:hypothetical protein AAVH_08558 [Aphelenchus avenae]
MSGLQDVTNENDHFWLISILHGQEAEEFRDWLDRTQLSRDDERWIVALLKSKYREGRREGGAENQRRLDDQERRIRQLQSDAASLEEEAQFWHEQSTANEDRCAALRRHRDRLIYRLHDKNTAIRALEQQLRDRTDQLREETEASEELEREIDAGRDEVRERNVLVEELREQITQLRACVHAERFLNIPIRPADTEYPQDPDTVVARVTKSRAIALFRKYMIGKRRSHEEADGFAGRNVAEFLDLLGVKERLHAESVALLSHVEMGVVRDRDVREQKRRRIE